MQELYTVVCPIGPYEAGKLCTQIHWVTINPIETTQPMKLVDIDILTTKSGESNKYVNIYHSITHR